MNYINFHGNLTDADKHIELSTLLHARDIQKERHTKKNIFDGINSRDVWFTTGDFPLYTMESGKAVLYMADCKDNMMLRNLDDAVRQFMIHRCFFPKESDIDSVISSPSTLRTELDDLRLKTARHEPGWSYFNIYTSSADVDREDNYDLLNDSQRRLAEKTHGIGEDFIATMKMLYESKRPVTKITVANESYIKKMLSENNAKGLALYPLLFNLFFNYDFYACTHAITDDNRRFRGMPLEGMIQQS